LYRRIQLDHGTPHITLASIPGLENKGFAPKSLALFISRLNFSDFLFVEAITKWVVNRWHETEDKVLAQVKDLLCAIS
jgi:hypothetical protein